MSNISPSSLIMSRLADVSRYKVDSYDKRLSDFLPIPEPVPVHNDYSPLPSWLSKRVPAFSSDDDEDDIDDEDEDEDDFSYATALDTEPGAVPSYTLNPSEIPEIIKSFTSKEEMSDETMFDIVKTLPLDIVASAVGTNENALMIALSAYASKNNYMAFSMRDYISVKIYLDSLLRMGSTFIPSSLDESYFIDTCNELANSLTNITSVASSKVFYVDESIPLLEITIGFIDGIDEASYNKSSISIKRYIDRFKNDTGARVDIIWTHKEVNV